MRWLFLLALAWMASAPSHAADRIRIAAQKTGTLAWELDVVRTHGLDRKAGLQLETVFLASPEAQKIALKAGNADIVVADITWVARERALGGTLKFYPFSTALGSVLVPQNSAIRTLADLRGRKLAIGGGPLDKSWIFLRAHLLREGIDLTKDATLVFGAPALLSEKARQGEVDAILNYWNFNAALESRGFRILASAAELQRLAGVEKPVATLGYVFEGEWAEKNADTLKRFLVAMREAKEILGASDAEWKRLAPTLRAENDAMLDVMRRRYREGIPSRSISDEIADTRKLFDVLVASGGKSLMGNVRALDAAIYYTPGSGS